MDWGSIIGNVAQIGASIWAQEQAKKEARKKLQQQQLQDREDALTEFEVSQARSHGAPTAELSALQFLQAQKRQKEAADKQINDSQMFSPEKLVGAFTNIAGAVKNHDANADVETLRDKAGSLREPAGRMELDIPKMGRGEWQYELPDASGGIAPTMGGPPAQLSTPGLLQTENDDPYHLRGWWQQ